MNGINEWIFLKKYVLLPNDFSFQTGEKNNFPDNQEVSDRAQVVVYSQTKLFTCVSVCPPRAGEYENKYIQSLPSRLFLYF